MFNLTSARGRSSYSEEHGMEIFSMAKLVYGLNESLDGYVDHTKLGPRLRGGVAKPAEVGRLALAQVSWPQRHACRG